MLRNAPFTLTPAARDFIFAGLDEYRELKGREAIPALVWIDSDLNAGRFPSHVGIGLFDVRAEIEDALYDAGGLEIGVAMAEHDFSRIIGQTIDYSKERGMILV